MILSGQQRGKLRDALINAYPNTSSLERMLSDELDKNLGAIAGEGSLQEIVFKLIEAANSQGWVEDLVSAARKHNPGNLELNAIAKEILNQQPRIQELQNMLVQARNRNNASYKLVAALIFMIIISVITNPEVRCLLKLQCPSTSSANNIATPTPDNTLLPPTAVNSSLNTQTLNNFKFQFQGCQRNGERVDCSLLITNLDKDRNLEIYASYNDIISRVIDNKGKVYFAKEVQFGGEKTYNFLRVNMIKDIQFEAVLSYEVNSEVDKFEAVEIRYYNNDTSWGKVVYDETNSNDKSRRLY
ncbi:hypothetical protein NIES4071_108000 (plasmid) [Calothrix sp. NIES-4071]|nr:hypothetical protein NIES4071_108000 [Calothrix sp. NIES-4071]BAZ64840.1 hypothetical protein NIES4105_105730 [Calothrix sp. NIES-4105]